MEATIENKLSDIRQLFRKYGAERAYIFGSATKDRLTAESDVDFLFSFPKDMDFVKYSDNYFALAEALEKLLGRKVDLVAEKTLHNPYLIESINESKVQLL
ncbi:MAG: nucleotidyltransferase domain-containing protein [Flavobacteriales bacterium]|nr:nucleotidyltransferase domain-containing protein [Flavobacteriales bacterium]